MLKKAAVVYCSPAGSTRRVAQFIVNELEAGGTFVLSADLGEDDDSSVVQSVIKEVEKGEICLFIGSPVYVNRPLPPVMAFISSLPENAGVCAVPFVTWGGVSSGIALYDMGKALMEKGCTLVGAAKVLAVHSIMWQWENPLGEGHPDEGDERLVRELAVEVSKRTAKGRREAISLSDLAYQSEEAHAEMEQMTLEKAKEHMPRIEMIEERCTRCGVCEEICPVQAITLSPYPELGEKCFYCFQCMRICPEKAIAADLTLVAERIRRRAKAFDERPLTKIWISRSTVKETGSREREGNQDLESRC